MFKKTKIRNSIILLLSAYIPMYVVIIIQNLGSLYDKVKNVGLFELAKRVKLSNLGSYILNYSEFFIIIVLVFFIWKLFLLLNKMLKGTEDLKKTKVTVKNIKDVGHAQITNYFAGYILPFITLDLTSITGLLVFIFLGSVIGYIYIHYELFYINPIISIFFDYNIYEANMIFKDGEKEIPIEGILLSQKRKKELLQTKIRVLKENDEYYFE